VNPHDPDMCQQTEVLRIEVVDLLPGVAKISHLRAKLDGNLLRRDPNVGLKTPEPTAPLPHVPVQPAVKVADEVVGQDVADSECSGTNLIQQR
jgi:hypothetical protein